MNLRQIAWRNLRQRGTASLLTGISLALGVMLVTSVITAYGVIGSYFDRNTSLGYSMVVGAKGDALQLVLNTVYYLSRPTQNIPYEYYQEFLPKSDPRAKQVAGKAVDGQFAAAVAHAIPYCMGDNYEGYKVVGTVAEVFEIPYSQGRKYEFAEGQAFANGKFFTAVVGAEVARRTGLVVGTAFEPTHGSDADGHKHDAFEVVGVLAPTGTPNDRAVFINIEGFYLLEGHDKSGKSRTRKAEPHAHDHPHEPGHDHDHDHAHEPLPLSEREVTAILVQPKEPVLSIQLASLINKGSVAQAVSPIGEISRFMGFFVAPTQWLLLALTGMIVVVAGVAILVGIYNSMSERQRDIAILRALGASRSMVGRMILLEATLLALLGGLAGWVGGKLLFVALNPFLAARVGVTVGLFDVVPLAIFSKQLGLGDAGILGRIPADVLLVPILMALAAAVGYLPARVAYRTDVATHLKH